MVRGQLRAELRQPATTHLIERSLRDHVAALPVVAAVDDDEDMAGFEHPHGLVGIIRFAAHPEPQDIHRGAEILHLEPGLLAHQRMAAIAADHEGSPQLQHTLRRVGAHADHGALLLDEVGCGRLHHHPEARIESAALAQKIQKIPLRHQGDEFAAGRQMTEIREGEFNAAEPGLELAHLLMRQAQEIGQKAELVHELERRGMNRVAAEVAQKIGVLLQHHDLDTGARQEVAEHHPGRAAAHHATTRRQPICHRGLHARPGERPRP
jgi:hypothetical protein